VSASPEPCEIPPELQKPKADKALMLINFQTTEQRLVDQVAVPRDTNEEAALATHLPKMDLAGVCLTADAAHTTKANCRQLTQNNGAEFLLFLKANQPLALAKAEQLLPGKLPPLRPARWTKTTDALSSANSGASPLTPRPWAWPGWLRSCASAATPKRCAKAG